MPKVPSRKLDPRTHRRQRKQDRENSHPYNSGKSGEATPADKPDMDVSNEAGDSQQLKKFLDWSQENGIILNEKVVCTSEADGVSANYGMMAADDIKKGENIFILPRPAALTPTNCSIADFIQQNEERLTSNSGWLPLILALMYEKLNPESKWRAYLDTFPNFDEMELPMFWPLSELDCELKGTGMVASVATDIQNMRKEYETVLLPLIVENPHIFKDERFRDFQFAKQISAFIMAYSFTDDVSTKQGQEDDSDDDDDDEMEFKPATIMVPMADLLNHVPEHNAELNLGEATFRMIAVRDINKGEEVYNTYGKVSNYTLLLMYGFSVRPHENPHNSIELRLSTIRQACEDTSYPDAALRMQWLSKKLSLECSDPDGEELSPTEVQKYVDDQSICLHNAGLSDTSAILKALRMDFEELEAKLAARKKTGENGDNSNSDDENWESDDEEDDEIPTDSVRRFDGATKTMLSRVADIMLAEIPSSGGSSTEEALLTRKQLFSKYVRDGQIIQLKNLKQLLTWYD